MDRTSADGNVDIGGGKRGYRDENLASGIDGTALIAADRNALQEEVMAVIEAAGITPSAADNAQMLAGLRALFGGGGSLGGVGWQKLPGGVILQWGAVARTSRVLSAEQTVTFPLAFPSACWVVIPAIDYDNAGLLDMQAGVDTPSTTQVKLLAGTDISAGEGVETRTFGWRWIALGN